MQSDLKYWLAFSHVKTITPKRFHKIINAFDSLEQAWIASSNQLQQAGLEPNIAQEILLRRTKIDPDSIIASLVQHRVQAVTLADEEYPNLLRHIHLPPPVLYFKGRLAKDNYLLAVVGSRKMSDYGKQTTRRLVGDLCRQSITIVSGLALGVDAQAHATCVDNKTRTIAILGSGLDKQNIYPSHNRYLADSIIANGGCLFSEHPIGTPPLKHHFPMRNRIIAGMCHGTLVTEAAKRSGALITAYQALENNREVFAVPGTISSTTSVGCNELLKKGARMVTSSTDILEEFGIEDVVTKQLPTVSPEEKIVYDALQAKPLSLHELAKTVSLQANTIAQALTSLELQKYVLKNNNGTYTRI